MSKRHLFLIAQSKFFIKSITIFGVDYNLWRMRECLKCGNFQKDCDFSFYLGSTGKCYDWYKNFKKGGKS